MWDMWFKKKKRIDMGNTDLMDFQRLKTANDGFAYALIVIDVFTKRVEGILLKQKTIQDVIQAFETILDNENPILSYKPWSIVSDKGGEFGPKFSAYLKTRGIRHYQTHNEQTKVDVADWTFTRIQLSLRKKSLFFAMIHKGIYRFPSQEPDSKSYDPTILNVYCNIISPILVGNFTANLLRMIPVQKQNLWIINY